jgi:zinc/manganese transport system substrate-binding protein
MRKSCLLTSVVLLLVQLAVAPALAADKIKVVASFSIIGDLVKQIGGDRVDVVSLVGPNTDTHGFEPTPNHAKVLLDANVIVINGLGLEGWADRLVKASGFKGQAVVASKGIKALAATEHDHDEHAHGKAHQHGRYDPHAWQEVANVKKYIANIRAALTAADPNGKAQYDKSADEYLKQLDAVEREINAAFAPIPKSKRRVITSHDAFTYYGDAYGVEFLAPQGVGGDKEPSARDVAALIRQIRREKIRAVFVENITDPRTVERIAKEAGVTIAGSLYSDALSEPSGPAPTYIDMMRHNTRLLAKAMQ